MLRYEVTSFDLCVQGFERLRSQDEFILCAYPDSKTSAAEVVDEFVRDIDSCMRPDEFDYKAAENAVRDYFAQDSLGGLTSALASVEWGEEPAPEDMEGNPIIAFLYVREVNE